MLKVIEDAVTVEECQAAFQSTIQAATTGQRARGGEGMRPLVLCLFVSLQGCSSCPGDEVPPQYVLRVFDERTNEPICDAEVRIDGESTVAPQYCRSIVPTPGGPATVTLSVTRAGYQSDSRTVSTRYESDDCGKAKPVPLEFELQPL